MAARAIWKGYLRLGDVVCAVALYTARKPAARKAARSPARETG